MAVCSGRLVSGSSDIRVWNLETWTLERVLKGHNGGVNELAVADNKLLGGFDDALIRVWDTTTWEVERVLEGHVGAVYAIALDDARLYSASFDKCIRVWY
jgi:WD40 repeat protein